MTKPAAPHGTTSTLLPPAANSPAPARPSGWLTKRREPPMSPGRKARSRVRARNPQLEVSHG